jgi:pimeloyl-ACP methyl ester carboxylesterase
VKCVTNSHQRRFSRVAAKSLSSTSYKPRPHRTAIPNPFDINAAGVDLSGEQSGEGPAIVLLHGLTATRRSVVHGSTALARSDHRVVSYDARGHGESGAPAGESAYEYSDLSADLLAVMDQLGLERAVLVGNSMGAATAMRFTLEHPDRVLALVQITPAYDGERTGQDLEEWQALADGLDSGGVDGFLAAYDPPVAESFRDTVMTFTRQRLERHRDLHAVARALRVVPASKAFDRIESLQGVDAPTLVIGSRDESDPGHPLKVAEAYSEYLPDAELLVEEEGKSPIAWQGAQLSKAILEFLDRRQVR